MKKWIAALLCTVGFSTPALALSYPVSGDYGQSSQTKPGPIDCTGKHVISFEGELLELRGDEALCVFSSARQALRAAVEVQRRLRTPAQGDQAFAHANDVVTA